MYTEEYEDRGFPFRDFLLKLILIIIFVFLLVWLLPKFIKPTTVVKDNQTTDITVLTSQIFNDNLDTMKEAAISYYTDERLPKEVGQYDQMTLGDMIGKKIITPLIDKNNKAVDTEGSYVKITKTEDEYILKVNIKDSEKEDYILVHLGCYTYCDTYICEKAETKVTIKGSKEQSAPQKDASTNDKKTENNKEDNDKKDDNNKDDDQKDDNNKKEENDKNNDKEEEKDDNKPSTPTTYQYEYTKTTGVEFSNWTSWSNWEKTSCKTKAVNCNENDTSCLYKLQLYEQKQAIGTYSKTKTEYKQVSSYSKTTCSKYNYIIIDSTTYTTTTTYNVVNTITSTTASSVGGWKYIGRASYDNPPRDTATTHYEFVGADFSYCVDECESLPNFYYDKYTYTGSLTKVANTTTVPGGTSTSSSSSSSVSASCGSYVTTTVPVYGYETVKNSDTLYGTVCYKSTKTRSLKDPGKTQYKWSSYNDTTLLNNGWTYTGAKRVKK